MKLSCYCDECRQQIRKDAEHAKRNLIIFLQTKGYSQKDAENYVTNFMQNAVESWYQYED